MAAECARSALLQKVMDNKEDAGMHSFHNRRIISLPLGEIS